MILEIKSMNEEFAIEILDWKYEPPYDFYNNESDPQSLKELMENSYYVVVDNNKKIVGYFCIGDSAKVPIGVQFGAYNEELIDIGIGMNPSLTGKGYGATFFSFILSFIEENFLRVPFRLTVAKFNQRAIHLYEKFGFEKEMEFDRGDTRFMTMVRGCSFT
ncbi:GNAT family N-acetyltransferase [Robertmurraya kyonggiensis]|uniref:GNAT family N-acetyltransferase n=1 Tax=Robertmurraya kyonggiensis TaxID=1037680 RepID=A0A4U1D957_9BACI|nr:GNAT family N-acetyltransferase [Robertmurraya kyonggiensis]TKC19011.1 GNAT family N-acetyltransferase [Robertmurraya kyonggiensis]